MRMHKRVPTPNPNLSKPQGPLHDACKDHIYGIKVLLSWTMLPTPAQVQIVATARGACQHEPASSTVLHSLRSLTLI